MKAHQRALVDLVVVDGVEEELILVELEVWGKLLLCFSSFVVVLPLDKTIRGTRQQHGGIGHE